MSLTIASIEERIQAYEKDIATLVSNHTALTGALNELKNLLDLAVKVGDVVAPGNPVVAGLDAVDHVADAVVSAE
jgi:hypothetical protein